MSVLLRYIVCVCMCVCVQEVGTLEVSGYVRGRPLSVNGLLHIPGLGDFQMTKVLCVSVCVCTDCSNVNF